MDYALIDCNSTINSNSYYPIKFNNNGLKRTVNHRVAGPSPAWGASFCSEQPQIEHKSKAVPMPDEFKNLYKKFLESKKLN